MVEVELQGWLIFVGLLTVRRYTWYVWLVRDGDAPKGLVQVVTLCTLRAKNNFVLF